jgi:hypothetical protein
MIPGLAEPYPANLWTGDLMHEIRYQHISTHADHGFGLTSNS